MNPSGSDFNKCHAHARQEPVQARWQYRMVTWTYRDTCLLRETPNEAWPLSVVGVGFQNHGTPVVQNHSPPGVPHRVTGGTSLMRPPVRRSAGSFPASFGRSLTVTPLRFPWVPVTKSPEDFHLPVSARAGRTQTPAATPKGGRQEKTIALT
jgi:hypothetical protein